MRAEPTRTYAVLRSLDLNRSRIVRTLFTIRTVPSRLRGRGSPPDAPPGQPFLETGLALGWTILEEEPGREFVLGSVTQPWAPVVHFVGLPGPDFIAFAEPAFTKIVWNAAVPPARTGLSPVSTETRVAATDPASRRRFLRYGFVFGPFIRRIRLIALRLVRRDLELPRGSGSEFLRVAALYALRPPRSGARPARPEERGQKAANG